MPDLLDNRLSALAQIDTQASLDGLEDVVWTKVQARKAASAAGSTVRVAVTGLALAGGLAFGVMHRAAAPAQQQVHVAELGVLSEDGLLAPSVRLGGGGA